MHQAAALIAHDVLPWRNKFSSALAVRLRRDERQDGDWTCHHGVRAETPTICGETGEPRAVRAWTSSQDHLIFTITKPLSIRESQMNADGLATRGVYASTGIAGSRIVAHAHGTNFGKTSLCSAPAMSNDVHQAVACSKAGTVTTMPAASACFSQRPSTSASSPYGATASATIRRASHFPSAALATWYNPGRC